MFLLSRWVTHLYHTVTFFDNRPGLGMYNAISGLGGSGQLDSTVAANATVALLAATAASALTLVPPVFDVCIGWNEMFYLTQYARFSSCLDREFVS